MICDKEETRLQDTQQRRFEDSGLEYGQERAKIPAISMNNCACDTVIRFFGNSVILIRFFSTKEKDLETRAMRSVYVFGFSATAIQPFLFDSTSTLAVIHSILQRGSKEYRQETRYLQCNVFRFSVTRAYKETRYKDITI